MAIETLQFQTETKRLLDLVINSIYTNKEIFLRELISNASDAIDKLRIESLTNHDILGDDSEFSITVDLTSDDDKIVITDNGIGMTREEVIANIGTIAKSGTKEFLDKLSGDTSDEKLIGQFGVGFYSAFIVSSKVELITKKAGTNEATKWISEGVGEYTLEDTTKETRGTTIILHLKPEYCDDGTDTDFSSKFTIQKLIKKYSNYIRYPIKLKTIETKDEKTSSESATTDDTTSKEKEISVQIVNSMKPLWTRNKSEITSEEYNEFFKQQFNEWAEPQETYHIKGEGTIEYTALLCVPNQADPNLYYVDFEAGLQLYTRNVFIMDKCKDFLPDHLRFVKGLVDSPDLPLNVSREILQQSVEVKKIGKAIEKNIIKNLQRMLKNDRPKYLKFWKEYGRAIKLGVYNNAYNDKVKDELRDLIMFTTTKSKGEYLTLAEYVSRMPEKQKQIYFAVGKDAKAINNLPQMEYFAENDIEVIYLLDAADEFSFDALGKFADMDLKSITRDGIKLFDDAKNDTDKDSDTFDDLSDTSSVDNVDDKDDLNKPYKDLLDAIKEVLSNDVNDVKITNKLRSSAACLSSGEYGPSLNVEQMYHAIGNTFYRAVRILELNPEHEVFKKLQSVHKEFGKDSDEFKNLCYVIYDQVLMMDGMAPKDPLRLAKLIQDMIVK